MRGNLDNPPEVTQGVLTATRVKDAASGDVAYTGLGFKPTAIIAIGGDNSNLGSMGFGDDAHYMCFVRGGAQSYIAINAILAFDQGGGAAQSAIVKSLDTDGFTLTWTLAGGGTTNDQSLLFIGLR